MLINELFTNSSSRLIRNKLTKIKETKWIKNISFDNKTFKPFSDHTNKHGMKNKLKDIMSYEKIDI